MCELTGEGEGLGGTHRAGVLSLSFLLGRRSSVAGGEREPLGSNVGGPLTRSRFCSVTGEGKVKIK